MPKKYRQHGGMAHILLSTAAGEFQWRILTTFARYFTKRHPEGRS